MNPLKQTDLLKFLLNDIPVVAVNRRLARRLISDYDSLKVEQGQNAWHRPPVLTYEAWLRTCLQQFENADALLSPTQVQRVWESILNRDIENSGIPLMQIPQSAKMAVGAYQLLTRYETGFSAEDGATDHRSFLRWLKAWRDAVDLNSWIEPSELPGLVADAILDGSLTLPEKIVFAGFDNLAPVDRRLHSCMQKHNCQVIEWQLPEQTTTQPLIVKTTGMDDEVRRCARWASAIVQADPDRRVAIVAPQLEQYQSLFQSAFLSEVDPAVMVTGEAHSRRMNMSLGQRLDRIPVIRALLKVLSTGYQVSLNDLGSLLRSPFLAGAINERDARALADRSLRGKRIVSWNLSRLSKSLEPLRVPVFSAIIESFTQRQPAKYHCKPGDWAEIFHAEIKKTGWPGDRILSSDDYQAVKRFYQTLEQLATLDRVSTSINRSTAVTLLSQLASEAIFQPESESGGIEVLGLLEAAGQEFDHLWVLGLHDSALPQPAQPNPFIPLPLQRRLEMPHADAERELAFARSISRRLFASAPEVVLSWPQAIDGAPCRPSPLLRPFEPSELVTHASTDPAVTIRNQRPPFEVIDDRKVVAIHSQRAVSGGTGIVKDQAICPFRAFAHHRLRAEGLDSPDIGLDGMARGTLIHTVLELFWQEVVSHEALMAMNDSAVQSLLKSVIDQSITRFERQRRNDLSQRQRRLETNRLERMARKWLDIDRQRPPFKARVEERHTETVGQLTLRTRIDRIDELDNGHIAIVDFKSGQVNHAQWLDQRVTEPQLPLYCLNIPPETIDAVLFAQLRGNDQDCRFAGLARNPDDWPGLKSSRQETLLAEKGIADFEAALLHWRKVLPELGNAFVQGEISVTPVNADSCRYCDVRPLCRIDMTTEGGRDD